MSVRVILGVVAAALLSVVALNCSSNCPATDGGVIIVNNCPDAGPADAGADAGPPGPKDITLVIGGQTFFPGTMTNGHPSAGDVAAAGAKFALDQINSKITVNGSRIHSITLQYDIVACTGAAGPNFPGAMQNVLTVADGGNQMIGWVGDPCSSALTQDTLPYVNAAGVAQVGVSSYVGLTKPLLVDEPFRYYPTGVRNFARTIPSDDRNGPVLANWIKSLGGTRVYVVQDTLQPEKGVADALVSNMPDAGLTLVGYEGDAVFDPTTVAAIVNRIDTVGTADGGVAAPPDFVFIGGTQGNTVALLKAMRADVTAGPIKVAVNTALGGSGTFITAAGAAANGVYSLSFLEPPSQFPAGGPLATWYTNFGTAYDITNYSVFAPYLYEGMNVMIAAITAAGDQADNPAVVRQKVMSTANFQGILGTWSFDANGDISAVTYSGLQVQAGVWTYLQTFNYNF